MSINSSFKAMADQNRRKILKLLRQQPGLNAGQLAAYFPFSRPALSRHLEILKQAELITSEKHGQFVHFFLNGKALIELVQYIIDLEK